MEDVVEPFPSRCQARDGLSMIPWVDEEPVLDPLDAIEVLDPLSDHPTSPRTGLEAAHLHVAQESQRSPVGHEVSLHRRSESWSGGSVQHQ